MKYLLIILLLLPMTTRESNINLREIRESFLEEQRIILLRKKHVLLMGVMHQETKFGVYMESPQSRREKAVGILQIRPGMILFLQNKGHNFSLNDRLDSLKSVEMFFAFQEMYNPEYDLELGCHIWNAGQNFVRARWHLTEGYRNDVINFTNTL
jgi:hypothetical protein